MASPIERLANLTPEQRAALVQHAEGMYVALCYVQEALANYRDDGPPLLHPEHGELVLEEVKYCVVDPALNVIDGSDEG